MTNAHRRSCTVRIPGNPWRVAQRPGFMWGSATRDTGNRSYRTHRLRFPLFLEEEFECRGRSVRSWMKDFSLCLGVLSRPMA